MEGSAITADVLAGRAAIVLLLLSLPYPGTASDVAWHPPDLLSTANGPTVLGTNGTLASSTRSPPLKELVRAPVLTASSAGGFGHGAPTRCASDARRWELGGPGRRPSRRPGGTAWLEGQMKWGRVLGLVALAALLAGCGAAAVGSSANGHPTDELQRLVSDL